MPGLSPALTAPSRPRIADQLNLSPKTISVHRDHSKEKLGFATSSEMIRHAVRFVEADGFADGAWAEGEPHERLR